MFWTRKPQKFKEWPRPVVSAEEREILSLFAKLPRKLPTQKLVGVYTEMQCWAAFKGMLVFSSLGQILSLHLTVRCQRILLLVHHR